MRIESIKIQNYRQFKNLAMYFKYLSGQNDLHIILAENGVGKTNIVNAITWCLYNEELHLRDKANAVGMLNSQVVEDIRQHGGGNVDVLVELVISTDSISKMSFKRVGTFHVSQDAVIPLNDKLTVSYSEDGGFRIVEDPDETSQLVHQYLPQEINNYIFFDGEQLEKFFSVDQLKNVRTGINQLTQASHLKEASDYIEHYVKENITPKISNSGDNDIKVQQDKVDDIHAQIDLCDTTIKTCIEQIEDCDNRISELTNIIHGCENVREKAEELKRSEERLNDLNADFTNANHELMKFAREYFTLFSIYPSVKKFYDYIEKQKSDGNLPPQIDKDILDKIITGKKCLVCGQTHLSEDSIAFVRHLRESLVVASETSNELSSAWGAMPTYFEKVKKYQQKKNSFLREINKIRKAIEEEEENYQKLNKLLHSIPDNEEIAKALDERDSYQKQRDILVGKKAKEEEAKKQNEDFLAIEDKKLRDLIAKKEALKDLIRKRDFCEYCISVMRTSMKEILDECRLSIQQETFRIFDDLIWKQGDFSKIEILENYSFRLLDRYGNQTLGSCSAAETSLLALSFTLALQEVSKHDALLFIDTPIGRVGTKNRTNFMNILLKVASEKQVILTFTPTEYDTNVQSILTNKYVSFHSLSMSEGLTVLNDEKK